MGAALQPEVLKHAWKNSTWHQALHHMLLFPSALIHTGPLGCGIAAIFGGHLISFHSLTIPEGAVLSSKHTNKLPSWIHWIALGQDQGLGGKAEADRYPNFPHLLWDFSVTIHETFESKTPPFLF